MFFKNYFQKTYSKLSLFSASRKVPENENWPAVVEIISWGFPLKWAKMNQSFPLFELSYVFIVPCLFLSLKFIEL